MDSDIDDEKQRVFYGYVREIIVSAERWEIWIIECVGGSGT